MASPKVATYDLKPEMSAYEVKDKLVDAIKSREYDFIVVNYANGDMVGHTGVYEAIEKAVKAVDECVKDTVEAAKAADYEVIIIADHGNADNAINADGTPNTAHSLNPCALYLCDRAQGCTCGGWSPGGCGAHYPKDYGYSSAFGNDRPCFDWLIIKLL